MRLFVKHCLMCTNGGHRHVAEYKSSPKPDAFYEVTMTILQCPGQFSGIPVSLWNRRHNFKHLGYLIHFN